MKFITSTRVLLEALNIAGRAVGGNKIIPILENYRFLITKDSISITGSNLETFLTTKIDIESDINHLLVCIPAAELLNFVKELPEQPLHFEITEVKKDNIISYKLTIKAGNGVYNLSIESAEDFPEISTGNDISFDITSANLKDAIDRSLFAVRADGSENPLCGISLAINNRSATYVGCNGQIMGCFSYEVNAGKGGSFILPAKAVRVLHGLPMDEVVNISMDAKSMRVQVNEDTVMEFVLTDNKYPDYKAILPTDQDKLLVIGRTELIGALRRVSNFANFDNTVKIDLKENKAILSASNTDFGKNAMEEVDCEYDGPEFTIGCSSKYMLATLNRSTAKEMYIAMNEPNKPIILRESAEFEDAKENLFLVMPQMLRN